MSRIICDVCGTSYQKSATQCPICGCVRPIDIVADDVESNEAETGKSEKYTYVKGGRFSKANVQKRNQDLLRDESDATDRQNVYVSPQAGKSDRGLVIALCALLVAILAVVIYIVLHFFAPFNGSSEELNDTSGMTTSATTYQTTPSSENDTTEDIEIVLSETEVTLESAGSTHLLEIAVTPAGVMENLIFKSKNEEIATISDEGEIVAISSGETVIFVSCGETSVQCRVVCAFVADQTEAETEPTTQTAVYVGPYRLSDKDGDVSIIVGETFQLKLLDARGNIVPVTWSATIADICTIDGNSITGAMKGKTEISTTYDDETFTCIVRVR